MDNHLNPSVRHDIVMFFDVRDGNPNGDPDAANQPRFDPETGHGLVTDVCIKRKIRNYVDALDGEGARNKIFIQAGKPLNATLERAYTTQGLEGKKEKGKSADNVRLAQAWMCENFFDVRMFGAVLSTGDHQAGKVQGPVQFTFARSVDPVMPADNTITRVVATRVGDDKETEMGGKWTVPYGLYRMHGFFSAHFAERTGVSVEDLEMLYAALCGMFDLDRSAARGEMALRGLYVLSHESKLGEAPAHSLTEQIVVRRKNDASPARKFSDYEVRTPSELPAGVSMTAVVA